jgi:hypothetical protein
MGESPETGQTFERTLAHAAHRRGAMVERRNIGLRIVVGIVAFDLIVLKLAVDAAGQVSDHEQLAWIVRLIGVGAFVVLTGMLIQLEIRNRGDRSVYRDAEKRIEELQWDPGRAPERPREESIWSTVRQSWATTWTLGGVLVLTIAMWWMAGLLTDQNPRPHASTSHSSTPGASMPLP